MHRLVIALTAFLTLVGAVVVAGYLFVFSAQPDRLARAVPTGTAVYATAYLQPSAGQKMNLAALLGRVPGFADAAALDQKIHEISARLLGEQGIDYERDVRPWLGDQLAVAVRPDGIDPNQADMVLLIEVGDPAAAPDAIDRLADALGMDGEPETHEGVELHVAADGAWALLEDLLVIGSSADAVRASLDADAGRVAALAGSARFGDAMASLPPDHLAALFVDLEATAEASGMGEQLGGYRTAGLALVAEPEGLRLTGSAPFDAEAAPPPAREAFALASEPSGLAEWMPADAQVEVVVFGLSQTLRAVEEQLTGSDAPREIADALTQLRAVAAFGLGVSIDDDILPLFDRETGLSVTGLEGTSPHGQLLLRPSDPDAAAGALDRLRDALGERGATISEEEADGETVTVVAVPDLATVAYAMRDDVIVFGLSVEDVAAALEAESSGASLAEADGYRAAWELAGARGGNELWVDAAAFIEAAGEELGVTGEARDILLQVEAVAMTAPARDDRSEFHVVLTMR